jgi:hypothetical protein
MVLGSIGVCQSKLKTKTWRFLKEGLAGDRALRTDQGSFDDQTTSWVSREMKWAAQAAVEMEHNDSMDSMDPIAALERRAIGQNLVFEELEGLAVIEYMVSTTVGAKNELDELLPRGRMACRTSRWANWMTIPEDLHLLLFLFQRHLWHRKKLVVETRGVDLNKQIKMRSTTTWCWDCF